MSRAGKNHKFNQNDYWEVSHAAGRVTSYACSVSTRHIKDGTVRLQFNREVAYYMQGIVRDVENGKHSVAEGMRKILRERNELVNQSKNLARSSIGIIAGVLQVRTGLSICSAGPLACIPGTLITAHGANNVYENSENLVRGKSDSKGPLRQGYRDVFKLMGKTEAEADIAYGFVDIALSGFSLMRLQLKPDAWRLFRYVRKDMQRGFEAASKGSLLIDGISTGYTLDSIAENSKAEIRKRE